MSNGLLFPMPVGEVASARREPRWVEFHRRGPILRPAARGGDSDSGVFGIDLTAGCAHCCPFCHIRGASSYPGDGRILFDPSVSRRLAWTLDDLKRRPELVVLSPASDPFPPHRQARLEALRVLHTLLERRIKVMVMTRGRIPLRVIDLLAQHKDLVQVAVAVCSLNRDISRALEPRATPPAVRVGRIGRLVEAGIPVEVRLEPLIAGLTDTRENIKPLFEALACAGARRVVAHYLFLHPAMVGPLKDALRPWGLGEKLEDSYKGGPAFPIGTLGTTKHLPLETRRAGFAALTLWGAEHGLVVETGSAQNPDLRRAEVQTVQTPPPRPRRSSRQGRDKSGGGSAPLPISPTPV